MRIAIIAEVFLPKIDGVVHRTTNLLQHLVAAGDEVLVVCPRCEGRGDCPYPVMEFPSFRFPPYPEYRIGLPDGRLVEAIEQFRPDVLHYINPFAFGFRCYDVLAKAEKRIPSVFSFHTLYGEFAKRYGVLKPLSNVLWWLTREYHNCADVNMTVSTIMQQELIERGFQRVEFWPPAVDASMFHPGRKSSAMRARLSQGRPERPLLLTVSRLAPEKNVSFLADVLREIPDACLAIVGDGPHRQELERRFQGLDANFVGYLQGEDLAAAYASADAFVYASEMETMGNVVLEAMACGCPVVAPRAGGIPSLATEGETALLYSPGEPQEAVRLTRRLLDDEDVRARLSAAARATVEEQTWRHAAERVRGIYRQTIEERRSLADPERSRRAKAVMAALVLGFRSLALRRR